MASTIFHHWLDQYRALPEARRRWIVRGLWGLAFLVVFLLGVAFGRGLGFPNGLQARAHALATRNAALQDELQGLKQQQQTASTSVEVLRKTLADRDAEVQKLKQDQALYSKLIGIDGDRSGLGVHSLALSPVAGTNAWNFVATLVNAAENGDPARGNLTLAVEGVQGGTLKTLDWSSLAGPGSGNGIPFGFKFFQQLRGSLALPRDFVPNRLVVTLHPARGKAVTRKIDWRSARGGGDADAGTP